jgi:transcriptional regulatory protein LEU3
MRRELEELKWNLRNDPSHVRSTPSSNIGTVEDVHNFAPYEHGSGTMSNASGARDSISPYENGPSRPSTRKGSHGISPTLPRALNGYLVDAKKIEDCFSLYKLPPDLICTWLTDTNRFIIQYHPLLPILDTTLSPNEYHDLSPFLFWSIIVTGSRRYSDDPTILDKTSQLITPLAFSSMALRSTPIPVIQGLLILCTWRLPTNSMYKDMTHVLCGAAIHLATQIGLHVAGVGQDFARMPLKKDQDQKILRAKLWMHCVIVSIRYVCHDYVQCGD